MCNWYSECVPKCVYVLVLGGAKDGCTVFPGS